MRLLIVAVFLGVLPSCSDEGEADAGGSGGAGVGASGSGASGTGAGGTGGTGAGGSGAGGSGGSGGSGGGTVSCLADPAEFAIEREGLCVVERWTAEGLSLVGGVTPSWGRHGGPLVVAATSTSATLTRWSTGDAGALTSTDETFVLTSVPVDGFVGSLAVDFTSSTDGACTAVDATAIAWTGADFTNDGEILTLEGGAATPMQATGVFGMGARAGRLFYSGLSAIDGPTNDMPALYAAGTVDCDPALVDDGVADAGFGAAAGPVAFDADGNLFAILVDFVSGDQRVHGYRAQSVSGALPLDPVELATLSGFGDALAAIAPADGEPGLVAFQPTGLDFVDGDVIALEYTTAGGALSAGSATTLLSLTASGTNLTLMTDPDNRLWVGVEDPAGTTFHVVARAPR